MTGAHVKIVTITSRMHISFGLSALLTVRKLLIALIKRKGNVPKVNTFLRFVRYVVLNLVHKK